MTTKRTMDCGDNSCFFAEKREGRVGTNGGCRCLEHLGYDHSQLKAYRALGHDMFDAKTPQPLNAWDEDDGAVLWWKFPIVEPPYVGTPLDDDFPDYVTHWTKIIVPLEA